MKHTVEEEDNEVVISIEKDRWGIDAVRMAAHVLADRAYAQIFDEDGELSVTLHSKLKADRSALEGLGALFDREVQNQALRLKLVGSNRETMEYIVSRGLVPANKAAGPEGAEPETELSDEQKSEIDRLIAEAETEIAELKKDKSGADPLGITKTWEEQNQ
ncbi:MAG: hypothetical protein COB53_12960 [Elusimicrobia bacterium]|nr:MAG: hypothetical protein COB53_12960 [Elusimicrobiota bacterium]